jgi:hypothetical protein
MSDIESDIGLNFFFDIRYWQLKRANPPLERSVVQYNMSDMPRQQEEGLRKIIQNCATERLLTESRITERQKTEIAKNQR